jgi:hypothetical protein
MLPRQGVSRGMLCNRPCPRLPARLSALQIVCVFARHESLSDRLGQGLLVPAKGPDQFARVPLHPGLEEVDFLDFLPRHWLGDPWLCNLAAVRGAATKD